MKTGILVVAVILVLALVWTMPLASHVGKAIPYTIFPKKGLEILHLFPGDHLQFYYRLWLFTDSLKRGSPFTPEAYEFNDQMGRRPVSSQFFPLSLAYALLAVLGHTTAYNLLLLLTFPLGGLFTYLLLRSYGAGFWGGVAAGLVAAFIPYRVGQLAGGHPNAFVYFVVPLILWLVERYVKTGRLVNAWLAGAAIFFQIFMELHAAFYTFLLLAAYLPVRWLVPVERWLKLGDGAPRREAAAGIGCGSKDVSAMLVPWAAAASASAFASFRLLASPEPPEVSVIAASALVWGGGTVYLWRLLSAILASVWRADSGEAAARVAPVFSPFLLLPLAGIKLLQPVPMLGTAVATLAVTLSLCMLGRTVRRWAKAQPLSLDGGAILRGRAGGLLPLLLGLAGGVGWILFLKISLFSGTGVEKGRTAGEAILFTPGLEDALRRVNGSVEFYLYPGLVCLLIIAAALLPHRGEPRGEGGWLLFLFGAAGAFFYLHCFGQNGDIIFPLHGLLRRLPLMGYGRVSSRAMIAFTPAFSVLVGVSLSRLTGRLGGRWAAAALGLLAVSGILTDYAPAASFGLTRLPERNMAYEEPGRLGGKGKLLEVPLWPGDSAWSSIYQYWVTRYRHHMVNGYSPVVPLDYFRSVFQPLAGVNLGSVGAGQADQLAAMGVDRLILHQEAFPPQVSYFPSRLTLRHLMASPYLRLRRWDGSLWLFDVLETPRPSTGVIGPVTSPVGIILWGASSSMNPAAVGPVGGRTAAIGSDPARPVVRGPDRLLPAGRYRILVRMGSAGEGVGSALLRLGDRDGTALGEMQWWWNLANGTLRDFSLPFELDTPRRVWFEVLPREKSSVAVDYVYIVHDDQKDPPAAVEFEDLAHYGRMEEEPEASGGMVVALERGVDPPASFNVGPRRRLPAGSWKITIEYRTGKGDGDPGEILLGEVDGAVLEEVRLRRSPVGRWTRSSAIIHSEKEVFLALEVRYSGGCDLYLDKLEVAAL